MHFLIIRITAFQPTGALLPADGSTDPADETYPSEGHDGDAGQTAVDFPRLGMRSDKYMQTKLLAERLPQHDETIILKSYGYTNLYPTLYG